MCYDMDVLVNSYCYFIDTSHVDTCGNRNGVKLETNTLVSYLLYCTVKSYNVDISSHHQRVNSFWKKAYRKIWH